MLFAANHRECGDLDILVNNAVVSTLPPINAVERDEVHRLPWPNVFAPMIAIKTALQHFRDGGSTINIGSSVLTMVPPTFLASDDARWITGEIIMVSGGAGRERPPAGIRRSCA